VGEPEVGKVVLSTRYTRSAPTEVNRDQIDSEPLVSVVTPVYNGAFYLEACIHSVLAQHYQNWEYIIVDNCSTDRTPRIAGAHADRDPRIRVYRTDAVLPIMKNWNHALRQLSPQSKYCKVVHADDWLFPQCLTQMVEVAENHPSAGLVGAYSLAGDRVVCDRFPYPSTFLPGSEVCRLALLDRVNPFWSPSSLLVRSDIIRGNPGYYDETEGRLHADVEACFETLRRADFGFVHQVLTFVRKHEDSMTATAAKPLNTHILAKLDLLTRYGPIFLSPGELRTRLRFRFKTYYKFLASSLFELRDAAFWRYHRHALRQMGYALKSHRLFFAALETMVRSPASTLAVFIKRLFKQVRV
jgi:glycosyltransferase involved in cell wall biosynthesis